MTTPTSTIEEFASREYEHGFVTDIEADAAPPGLSEEIMGALNESGIMQQAWSSVFAPADGDTPVEQLEKLAELHKKGVLTDYEFAVAKQKLLGEHWET